jgi:hypothetical protein
MLAPKTDGFENFLYSLLGSTGEVQEPWNSKVKSGAVSCQNDRLFAVSLFVLSI